MNKLSLAKENPRREIEMDIANKRCGTQKKSRTNPKREIEHRKKKKINKTAKKNKKNHQAYK